MILFVAFWYDSWSGGGGHFFSMRQKHTLRPVADHLPRNVHFHAPAARPNVWNEGFSLLGEPRNNRGPLLYIESWLFDGDPDNGVL